jgi:hypothetical protein
MSTDALAAELRRERDAFLAALSQVEPGSLTTPGLVGEWSARDLIAHLGYWVGHATEIIHAVESGRADKAGVGEPSVDEVNATVARVASTTPLATVQKREAASVEALLDRLGRLAPPLLAVVLRDGATLEQGIREDGAEHYREHAEELRRLLEAPVRG